MTNLHRGEDHLTSRLYVLYLIGEALAFTIWFGFIFLLFIQLFKDIIEPIQKV